MYVVNDNNQRLQTITMVHNGEELVWQASAYDQPVYSDIDNIFRDINEYWEILPTRRQAEIFDKYKEIHELLTAPVDFELRRLLGRVTGLVQQLYKLMPFDEFRYHILNRAKLVYPASLREEYDPSDIRDLTYLRKHYIGLATLTLALRPVVPIWAEFFRQIARTDPATKERLAIRLISTSNVFQNEERERLYAHVVALSKNAKPPMAALLDSIGTEDLPDWLFALALVRRVAIGELSRTDTNISIISNVYRHVTSNIDQLERKFGGRVTEKHVGDDNEEDNSSLAEKVKARQKLSPGDSEFFDVSIGDHRFDSSRQYQNLSFPWRLAQRIEPNLDRAKMEACINHMEKLAGTSSYDLQPFQRLLTQYVMSIAESPRAVNYLQPRTLAGLVAMSQGLLWQWGFPDLAILMTVTPARNRDGFAFPAVSRQRVTKELIAELESHYPHYREQSSNNGVRGKEENPALVVIDKINKMLSQAQWSTSAPKELIKTAECVMNDRDVVIPSALRNQLARLILKIITTEANDEPVQHV